MSKQCFCGCGAYVRRFPLGMRAINTRGRQVVERIDRNRAVMDAAGIFERGAGDRVLAWFEEGNTIVNELRSALHGDIDPRTLDEAAVRAWQAEGRDIERITLPMVGLHARLFDDAAEDLGLNDEDEDEDPMPRR